jgi:hypothetical protein
MLSLIDAKIGVVPPPAAAAPADATAKPAATQAPATP